MAWASVRLSVRLSVTLLYCIKTVQARITKFTLCAAPKLWVRGFPSNEGVKGRYPLKKTLFCRYWLFYMVGQKTCHFTYIYDFANY